MPTLNYQVRCFKDIFFSKMREQAFEALNLLYENYLSIPPISVKSNGKMMIHKIINIIIYVFFSYTNFINAI